MGQSNSGGGGSKPQPRGEIIKLGSAKLVVENVEVVRIREVVKVPEVIIETETTTKYEVETKPTMKYVVEEKPTTKYSTVEASTVRYNIKDEETIRYIPKDVSYERPVPIDKPYERPVVTNKEHTLVTFKDMEAIRELMVVAPLLIKQLKELKKYKLVEEVVKVPRIQYESTKVERIIWIDKERCTHCGKVA